MEVHSTWVIAGGAIVSAIATVFIALYAVANHRLAREVKHAGEKHQLKMNEILKSISKAIFYNANSESRREIQKELKEATDKRAGNFTRKQ